jgi:dihydrofolate reductase
MRKIKVFNQLSLDGYFTDPSGDMQWAHRHDPEWTAFASENASGGGELLFGRKTYEMMASFWPTPQAMEVAPVVAKQMNAKRKAVFSRTLKEEGLWNNTRLVKGDLVEAARALKAEPGEDCVIMGSGSVITQLVAADLVDEFQLVIVPIVLGSGRTIFEGVKTRPRLKLERTRPFSNGNVVLWYTRA